MCCLHPSTTPGNTDADGFGDPHPLGLCLGRREALAGSAASMAIALSQIVGFPIVANAAVYDNTPPASPLTASDVLKTLGSSPTFVLVQGDTGVPFMIFNGEAGATGYFFLSYNIAEQALQDAREKDKQNGAANIWNEAQIRVVPLSIAMQLALTTKQLAAVNEEKGVRGEAIE